MAAYSHQRAGSRNSIGGGEQDLPSGSCNYRDLSIGSRAPICGCTRFWLNLSHLSAQDGSERAWCFCGHHACFHNAFSQQQRAQEQTLGAGRLTSVEQLGNLNNGQIPDVLPAQEAPPTPTKPLTGLGIHPGSRSQSQSINTRVWQALNDSARNQEDGVNSEAISNLPSTNAPSLVEEPRLSPNRMLLERLQHYRPMAPPVSIPPASVLRPAEEYSATEVATPSIAGTPDFRALAPSSAQHGTSPAHLQPGHIETHRTCADPVTHLEQRARPSTAPHQQSTEPTDPLMSGQDIQSIIRAYGHRIEVLESLSFSHIPVEEIQDKFELFDGRVLDLEQWRMDQERTHVSSEPAKASSSKRRRLLPAEGSFGSDASFDSAAAAHTEAAVLATLAANAETHPRIDALESRVNELENASPPSFARPWQVQVVFLPWGRDLRGVWFSAMESTQHSLRSSTQLSEEWTGAQSAQKLSFKSSVTGAWTTESIQAWANGAQEWLSPKACGPGGAVFQRLASRGLVRDVTITASDSRHILHEMNAAFGLACRNNFELDTNETTNYQGLCESFIPLRKIRKSARLRFLSPAEMVTSACWTAPFLDSGVFMKVNEGQRRLYVTTPEAYVQPVDPGWSWNLIRELPSFDASDEVQAAQNTNATIEACWTFNDKLDEAVSVHSSFASHESQWSTRSQLAADDAEVAERQPISPRSESRSLLQRTFSLPSSSSGAERVREILPKRRVASFETGANVAFHADEPGAEIAAKRRRISLSPEAERRGVNFTPRWSREPPSPFTSEAAVEARSQGAGSRKRGNTPFAYATPHSNNNFVSRLSDMLGGDGDTEADTDIVADHSERAEEEWEGVEDENTNQDDDVEAGNHEDNLDED